MAALAVAGGSSPADLAGVVAVDVAALADAGMVTVVVAGLAVAGLVTDAGMVFQADLAGVVTVGVAPRAVGGMTFPADPAGAVAVGVAGLVNVVDVPKCGGGDVSWDDRMLLGNGIAHGLPVSWTRIASMLIMWAVLRWRCLVGRRLLDAPAPCRPVRPTSRVLLWII